MLYILHYFAFTDEKNFTSSKIRLVEMFVFVVGKKNGWSPKIQTLELSMQEEGLFFEVLLTITQWANSALLPKI
jgi:hypothetical protein